MKDFSAMLAKIFAITSGEVNSEPTKKATADQTKQLRLNYARVLAKCDAECDGNASGRLQTTAVLKEKEQCREACKVDMGTVSPLAQTCEEAVQSWGGGAGLEHPDLECQNRRPVLIEVGYTNNTGGKEIQRLRDYSMSEQEWLEYLRKVRTGQPASMNDSKIFKPKVDVLCPKTIDRTNGLDRYSGAPYSGFGYRPSFQTLEFNLPRPRLTTTGIQRPFGVVKSNMLETPLVVTRSGTMNTCEGNNPACAGLDKTACKQKPAICNWNDGSWNLDLYIRCWDKSL